ncbi:MAG: 2,3-bisphosphoglycerate-independent phosphoglycerate mutase [Okeania sp. SIO2H7]|nr:2,3-bisphosphoglycerate-independent phosphoglycerate mutase [Okeania sp. SIO2H7]
MTQKSVSPVVLIILDGWGYREQTDGNAIAVGNTPVMDSLWQAYPRTLIRASGKAVGLPEGQMGNSEVGHINIGAGRIVPQELVRISDAVEDGSILENKALLQVCQDVRDRDGKLHLIGLCSDGGVHSHIDHLIGLLGLAKAQGISEVCIHAITDGRDTPPKSGVQMLKHLQYHIDRLGVGRIATISGRYYAMDRDKRWDRVKQAYDVIATDSEPAGISAEEVLQSSYAEGITDEFVVPTRVAPGSVKAGDGVIFFNFRPDRARELTQALVVPDFKGFEREQILPLTYVTFTQYEPNLPVLVAFEPQNLTNILAEVIANNGMRQLRTAETEKYAHVTYFFNGGLEQPVEGEDRELVQSPMVPTYDRAPEMSAREVTDGAIAAVEKGIYSLIVINYANPDMVGHTGMMDAAVKAVETVDTCLGELVASISKGGGTAIIIADHGNVEYMWDENGNPWTAHTTNLVPFILIEGEGLKIPEHGGKVPLREDGRLCDVAPTILEILGLPQPTEMTGRSIIERSEFEVKPNRTPVGVGL